MDKPMPVSHPLIRAAILLALPLMLAFSIMLFSPETPTAQCTGCQACYCDDLQLVNGVMTCIVNGEPSACVGCIGSCSGEPPNAECKATPQQGGCGAYIAWERDSDCNATPEPPDTPTPPPTATPTPPASCPVRTWVKVQKPQANKIEYEPPFPLVARQDTTNTGFTLHFDISGGWAKKYEQRPEQMCRSGGTYPDDCPNDWQWVCVRRVIEQYDDPIVQVDLGMRLGDGVKEWIENDLGSRYYGATTQEDLPRVWQLYKGPGVMRWTDDFEYHPFDPGTHGGRLMVKTKGTPLNPPQDVSFPYSVPVYLWDTTLGD